MGANKLSNSGCDGSLAFGSRLLPHLMPVLLPRGKVLCDADEPLRHVYFIETGLVSLLSVFEDGTTAEMAIVGRPAGVHPL